MFVAAICLVTGVWFWWSYLHMPGQSYQSNQNFKNSTNRVGELDNDLSENVTASPDDIAAATQVDEKATVQEQIRFYVTHLANTIGERNLHQYEALCEAADFIETEFVKFGYATDRQKFQVHRLDCFNVAAEITGSTHPEEIVIVGAHYDSIVGTPGANDNGSGTAAMLTLADHFSNTTPERTLRFVAFTNEEPPYFQTRDKMGSWVYAAQCRQRDEKIVAVLSLETMGYFSDEPDSQKYPAPLNLFYPSTGNFIGFVSNFKSTQLQRQVIKSFREHAEIPSEGVSLPEQMQGVGWSDHWSFWQEDYVGIMVTDTAPFRYPHYHKPTDTPEKLDYARLAKVVQGLTFVVEDLLTGQVKKTSKDN